MSGCVAIIPARGGSKGLRDKNLKTVGGLSLVKRSIYHAQASKEIDRVVVTSDSDAILEEAASAGSTVELVKRPAELATDDANGDAVIVHALQACGYSGMTPEDHLTVFLQPTAPIRPAGLIDRCVNELRRESADSLLTLYPGHFAWYRSFSAVRPFEYEWVPVRGTLNDRTNRQQIRADHQIFIENGCVYVSRTKELLRQGKRLFGKIRAVHMDRHDSIDVDYEYDLWLAETRCRFLGPLEAVADITESPVPAGYVP